MEEKRTEVHTVNFWEVASTKVLGKTKGPPVARACPWDLVDKLMKKYAKSRSMRLLLEAHFSDVYVAPLEKLSAAGMVSDGYDGDHEIVCPGFYFLGKKGLHRPRDSVPRFLFWGRRV